MEIWNTFLGLALDGPAHLGSQCLIGVPYIGRLNFFRMCDLLFKLFRCQANTMGLCQRQSIIFYVITDCALNLGDLMTAACYHTNHIYPENIFHTASHKGTAVLFRCYIQNVGTYGIGRPTVGCLLTGGDDTDTAFQALHIMIKAVAYQAEQGYHCNIGITLVQNLVCVVADKNAGFYTKSCVITYIHAQDCRIGVNCAYDLASGFIKITKNIFAHFTTSVLNHFNFFHRKASFLMGPAACFCFLSGLPFVIYLSWFQYKG